MNQHQQHPPVMHHGSPRLLVGSGYATYTSSWDNTTGYLVHPQVDQAGYPPVFNNTSTSWQDLQPALEYHRSVHMMSSYERDLDSSSANTYDPLSSLKSGSDTSIDGIYQSRGSNTTSSFASFRGTSPEQLYLLHVNPIPSPSSSVGGRNGGNSISDDEIVAQEVPEKKKIEGTRKLKAEDEKLRRDNLRDAYAGLRVVLGISDPTTTKISLLKQATKIIVDIEEDNCRLQQRLAESSAEARLSGCTLNESLKVSFRVNDAPSSEQVSLDSYPWLPLVDGTQSQASDMSQPLAEAHPSWSGNSH